MAIQVSRALALPPDQFFNSPFPKSGIALHHTVGGTAASTVDWWKRDGNTVGTAYLIDTDGTIYEVFDPRAWAWQFGLKAPDWDRDSRIGFEKRFIGIEIASEGGLVESEGKLYCFDRISSRTWRSRSKAIDFGVKYRGYRYFDKYETAQVDAVVCLVNHLCDTFNIPRAIPVPYLDYHGTKLKDFKGIIGHTMVRLDKSDPAPDHAFYGRLIAECNLQQVPVGQPPVQPVAVPPVKQPLTALDIEALFRHNVTELNKMAVAAGSMVKGVVMELERGTRKTYIRLHDPVVGGHKIQYDFVEGDENLVRLIALALGLKVSGNTLEVRHA